MKRMIAGGSMGTEGRKKIRRSALAASLRGVCVIAAALVLITNLGRGFCHRCRRNRDGCVSRQRILPAEGESAGRRDGSGERRSLWQWADRKWR